MILPVCERYLQNNLSIPTGSFSLMTGLVSPATYPPPARNYANVFSISSSGWIQVLVEGLYGVFGRVYFSAAAGGNRFARTYYEIDNEIATNGSPSMGAGQTMELSVYREVWLPANAQVGLAAFQDSGNSLAIVGGSGAGGTSGPTVLSVVQLDRAG
jgi:hypothetical protein